MRRALSKIGNLAYRVNLRDQDVLIAIRAYLDSSGILDDNYLTLAAFAGNDELWREFENEWNRILKNHVPPAKYVHMKELARQIDGFDWRLGWNMDNSFGLVIKCLMYVQHLDKKRFRMFYCAIDLAAWRKLKAETYQLPNPLELGNQFCSEMVMNWYLLMHPEVFDPESAAMHYFFDRGDIFKQPFEDKWKMETSNLDRSKGDWTIWSTIKEVCSVDMKDVPGVQASDILAWSVNKENTAKGDVPGKMLSEIMRAVIPSGIRSLG